MRLQFVQAGEVVTTHGVKGEMKVLPWLDCPEYLLDFDRVRVGGKDYAVETCRVQKTCNLLKVKGIDSMEAAQAMRGKVVEIYREDVDPEIIFADELIDVEVFSQGQAIGKIVDVLDYPGNKVYVVRGEFEYMIPAVKQFILSTDVDANRMEVSLIEGMRTDES